MKRKERRDGKITRRQFIKTSLAAGGLGLMLSHRIPPALASSQKKTSFTEVSAEIQGT